VQEALHPIYIPPERVYSLLSFYDLWKKLLFTET